MRLIEKQGDLFNSTAPALAHGVNTAGLMGAGIAVKFKRMFPEMYGEYKSECRLGTLNPGGVFIWQDQITLARTAIYNIASQDKPGPHARLEWFESGLVASIQDAELNQLSAIAMPRIGCGIGGLLWEDVRDIVEHYAEASELVDIEVWTLDF